MKGRKKKPVFLLVSIAVFIVALFLILIQNLQPNLTLPGFSLFGEQEQTQQTEYSIKKPEEVTKQYFESWDIKDWPNMYATISDGFKRIDSDAKNFQSFIKFAGVQGVSRVEILNLNLESYTMDDQEMPRDMPGMPNMQAIVAYSVEFTLSDGGKQTFSDKFTLKFRQGDVIAGWKLIHPYGQNIDTS